MRDHERYMCQALALARKAAGLTNPNPAVGAVIVKGGRIVGRGYHRKCGLPHAEVEALRDAGPRARGGTMYVTLEPCDHTGRTGPCTKAIIAAGITKVVIAMRDPNPLTDGRGIRRLASAGIDTVCGICEAEARELNLPFAKFIRTSLPYVTVKTAASLDGKIASRTGDSRWISSEASRRVVHALRGRVDAVMVGSGTVLRDDPRLLPRGSAARLPARVIVDTALRIPVRARVLKEAKKATVYIATAAPAGSRRASRLEKLGAHVLFVPSRRGMVDLAILLRALGELGMMHVLVEGGGGLVAGLVERSLADEFLFFIAPKLIGGRDAVTPVEGAGVAHVKDAFPITIRSVERVGCDLLVTARRA